MRRAAAVDANQTAIIRALRKAGVSVQPLHTVGQGCPDIIAGFRGVNYLLELKDGSRATAGPSGAMKLRGSPQNDTASKHDMDGPGSHAVGTRLRRRGHIAEAGMQRR